MTMIKLWKNVIVVINFLVFNITFASTHIISVDKLLTQKTIPYAERAFWYEKLRWPADCEHDYSAMDDDYKKTNGAGLAFWKLSHQRYLIQVLCALSATQPSYIFMIYTPHQHPTSTLLLFKSYDGKTAVKDYYIGGIPTFDAKTQTLMVESKSSACAHSRLIYQFDDQKNQPVLRKQIDSNLCD
ncbi:MAG: hypothetical protein KIT27_12225 [Legionellales bacterium]|nr:hypothetical protein [Legionellales bacterium]